jgi:hypothetical protein
MVTTRVSGLHPEPGICTVTEWSPTGREMLMGVTLPVAAPSTKTCAPDGKEVTFRAPLSAEAPVARPNTATAHSATSHSPSFMFLVLMVLPLS